LAALDLMIYQLLRETED